MGRRNTIEDILKRITQREDGCWEWRGHHGPRGYAIVWYDAQPKGVHVFLYEHFVGPIPDGMECDHLCNNAWCVNWNHMKPATPRDNRLRSQGFGAVNARKTHCPSGHAYEGENLCINTLGSRVCRACKSAERRRRHERMKKSS